MPNPHTAPPGLQSEVVRNLGKKGIPRSRSARTVVPFVQKESPPNMWTPRGEPRWIARCPECPGAEVVPGDGPFVCGSCGVEADVDWSVT